MNSTRLASRALLVLFAFASCTPTAAVADDQGVWAPLVPPWRTGHSAVYDPVADRWLLFGGRDFHRGVLFDDVWEYSFGPDPGWKRLTPAGGGPGGRIEHSAIFDLPRNRMIVFGGRTEDFATHFNDAWALDLAGEPTWIELHPPEPLPSTRYNHTATYDPVRERMVVFGGIPVYDDNTWTLSLAGAPEWTEHDTESGEFGGGAWSSHSAVYDDRFDRVVVFGGAHGLAFGYRDDTWVITLGDPMTLVPLVTPGGPPPARGEHAAAYDRARDRMLVFGGDVGFDSVNDLWQLTLPAFGAPTWTALLPGAPAPEPRNGHSAVLDPVRDRMIMFGKAVDADSWELSLAGGGVWKQLSPVPRIGHSAIYDPSRHRMLVFCGIDILGAEQFELWSLTLGDHAFWSRMVTSGLAPRRRWDHSAVYDPLAGQMIIFGGVGDGELLRDTHALLLAGEPPIWISILPLGPRPDARRDHSAIFDPVRNRMIVLDGIGGAQDVWALDPAGAGAWVELLPPGGPPADRSGHAAIYDPVRDRMVTFAGDGAAACLSDLWVLNMRAGEVWDELLPVGGGLPSERSEHTAVYDPLRDRMVVFAGSCDRGGGPRLNNTYAIVPERGPRWQPLLPTGEYPPPRVRHSAIAQPDRDRMVVYGGLTSFGYLSDVYALTWSDAPTPVAAALWRVEVEPDRVSLVWFSGDRSRPTATVERRVQASEWTPVGSVTAAVSGYLSFVDTVVVPGGRYGYRLAVKAQEGFDRTPETWVDVPGAPEMALGGLQPNPAEGKLLASFSLPARAPARLELLDVTGRAVLSRDVGELGPGSHLLDLGPASRLPAGVYLIRLTQRARSLTVKAAILN